jgi:hypothetical protein
MMILLNSIIIKRFFIYTFFAFLPMILSGQSVQESPVSDGFYLIIRQGNSEHALLPIVENEAIITFSDLFMEKTDPGALYLIIDQSDFVPMNLAEKPEKVLEEDNRSRLLLTLTDEAKIKLAAFTKSHLNHHTCIVVNGKALTMHKVRTVIDGGKMQITRCTDNACEILYPILEKNVVD